MTYGCIPDFVLTSVIIRLDQDVFNVLECSHDVVPSRLSCAFFIQVPSTLEMHRIEQNIFSISDFWAQWKHITNKKLNLRHLKIEGIFLIEWNNLTSAWFWLERQTLSHCFSRSVHCLRWALNQLSYQAYVTVPSWTIYRFKSRLKYSSTDNAKAIRCCFFSISTLDCLIWFDEK